MDVSASEVLRGSLLDFMWDNRRLHTLDLPVESLRVAELRWHLDRPLWRDGDELFAVSANQVRARPDGYPEHWRRTWAADLSYPIEVVRREGRWVILDGLHRLLQADLRGWETIGVRVLSDRGIPEICPPTVG